MKFMASNIFKITYFVVNRRKKHKQIWQLKGEKIITYFVVLGEPSLKKNNNNNNNLYSFSHFSLYHDGNRVLQNNQGTGDQN